MNTVADRYHELANGSIRPIDWEIGISWTKARNTDIDWFTLDQSVLDGDDLLADDENNPIQPWDAYDYQKQRDRLVEMDMTRSVEFPYNVQSAVLDFTLNNYDGYYNFYNSTSPLAEYIVPGRPIRAYLGFKEGGLTPVFIGLTEGVPTYSGLHNTKAQFTAMDFLSAIGEMSLRNMVMMRDARTDEVISVILQQFGLAPYMYNLAEGTNVIPFVYFESGKNAGNALRELVQAENGAMWIDEQGVIRFEPRTAQVGKESVMVFNPDNIVEITPNQTSSIVNRVYVEADVRKVMEFQPFYVMDNENGYTQSADEDSFRVKANGSTTIWLSFEDPVWSATTNPVQNGPETDSNFTAVDLSGDTVRGGITVEGTLFATSMKLNFTNTNNFPVSIDTLQIWGEPAKVVGDSPSIKYTAEDEDSIERFGVHELRVTDNTCFGNQQNIDLFANDVLSAYAGFAPVLELQVKGDPSLQLQDIITIEDTDYDGTWVIKSMSHKLADGKLTTKMSVVQTEIQMPFILNQSQLDGPDVLT